ncbi:putative methyltransferase-like protein 25 [Glossina fuscipes fuscipes]
MTVANLRKRLDAVLTFLEPYWEWVNCHMVNFLTDNTWETFVPAALQKEVVDASQLAACIETIFWSKDVQKSSLEYPECYKFVKLTQQHSLHSFDDILLTLDKFREINNIETYNHLNVKEFMSFKKKHEVEMTVNLLYGLLKSEPKDDVFIIDAGDGKGYLSSRLALEYGYKVLGIDSNQSNTESALERNRKLQKAWLSLKARAEIEGLEPTSKKEKLKRTKGIAPSKTASNYKTTSRFITNDLVFSHLLKEHFPDANCASSSICLTGLHTCGNLASTCLRVYHSQPECKFLCNIGCCYHLIKEMYSNRESFANMEIMNQQTEPGFPMSQYLQEKQIQLGRNARMLAAQSLERVLAAKQMPSPSLFYRALLEAAIREADLHFKENIQIGKIKNYHNFEEYATECLKKYPFLPIKIERVKYIQQKYQHSCRHLELFYMLRLCFSPVLETVILLDRLLYLYELNYTQSYLIPLFDPIISPRHYAIISIKK